MDEDTKKILLYILGLSLGCVAVFSGYFWKAHIITRDFLSSLFGLTFQGMALLLAIFLFLAICSILLITPIPSASCPLFLKIAYELLFGSYKESAIFTIGMSFKPVIAVLCIIAGLYSLYMQYKINLIKRNFSDKDLVKFI